MKAALALLLVAHVCFCVEHNSHLDLTSIPHSDYHEFDHHSELFAALQEGSKDFFVTSTISDKGKLVSLARIHSGGVKVEDEDDYDLQTTYRLHHSRGETYHILDNDATIHVQNIQDNALEICSSKNLKKNDYIVGSALGLSSSSRQAAHVQEWLVATDHVSSKVKEERELLAISRRVLSVSASIRSSKDSELNALNCVMAQTETINPLLLFASSRVETIFEKNNSSPEEQEMDISGQNNRRLQQGMTYGSGLGPIACDQSIWQAGTGWFSGWKFQKVGGSGDDDYMVKLDTDMGCGQLNKTVEIFNFNYDATAMRAASTLDFGSGITCTNCWAYLGASMYMLAEYTSTRTGLIVRVEAKASGAAGANINLVANNPSFSGSYSGQFLGPSSSWNSKRINSYLKLYYKMGGLNYAISGSGSATGTAEIQGGILANLGIEATYDETNGFETGITKGYSYTAPQASVSLGSTASFNAQVQLTGIENSYIKLGYSIISADLYADEILVKDSDFQIN